MFIQYYIKVIGMKNGFFFLYIYIYFFLVCYRFRAKRHHHPPAKQSPLAYMVRGRQSGGKHGHDKKINTISHIFIYK